MDWYSGQILDIRGFQILCLKEYFPNLLENWLLRQIFVYWVRDFKLWLLAYFLILLTLKFLINNMFVYSGHFVIQKGRGDIAFLFWNNKMSWINEQVV